MEHCRPTPRRNKPSISGHPQNIDQRPKQPNSTSVLVELEKAGIIIVKVKLSSQFWSKGQKPRSSLFFCHFRPNFMKNQTLFGNLTLDEMMKDIIVLIYSHFQPKLESKFWSKSQKPWFCIFFSYFSQNVRKIRPFLAIKH